MPADDCRFEAHAAQRQATGPNVRASSVPGRVLSYVEGVLAAGHSLGGYVCRLIYRWKRNEPGKGGNVSVH